MHNLHFIVTPAADGKDACSIAESYIEDWGTDDNWRVCSGAVSEDNKVYVNKDEEGRFDPKSEGLTTIKKINDRVREWTQSDTIGAGKGGENLKAYAEGKELTGQDWYCVRKFAEQMQEIAELKQYGKVPPEALDVLKNTFYAYKYNECGVTHTGYEKGDQKLWVVFVDMHD